jgi:calcineurin-like phosphoesterase family protein
MLEFKKTKNEKTPDVFIFSDPHYNHRNLCRWISNWEGESYEKTRNYYTLEDMNNSILKGINSTVDPDDILICLGDWSFNGIESAIEFREKIACKTVHLVLGNHDNIIAKNTNDVKSIFTSVEFYQELNIFSEKFMLMHYPIESWNGMRKSVCHLHGHMHYYSDKRITGKNRMDVGLDGHPEFRPYHIMDEIIPILKVTD